MTEIGPIAVHPDWQGKGVGRQLMTTIESRAKGGKCTVGIVSCRSDIIPFFEHMGYEVSSLWPNNDLRSYLIRLIPRAIEMTIFCSILISNLLSFRK